MLGNNKVAPKMIYLNFPFKTEIKKNVNIWEESIVFRSNLQDCNTQNSEV